MPLFCNGRTQQIDTDDDFKSFFHIMFYETPLYMSSGFCELWGSSTLSTRACCVTSAELTIKKTQRQLQSEDFIISNLKMNFHHTSFSSFLLCNGLQPPYTTFTKRVLATSPGCSEGKSY